VLDLMQMDKKAGHAGLRLVLLEAIGRGVVVPAPDAAVLRHAILEQIPGSRPQPGPPGSRQS